MTEPGKLRMTVTEKTGYFLLKTITRILHLFPLRICYLFSDLLFFLAYIVFRYRRHVVNTNLANAFPGKTREERSLIARKFYRHLCDMAIETLYFDRVSTAKGKDCVKYLNPELAIGYLDQGRDVIGFLGHYNNWEWFVTWPLYSRYNFYPIYKKLTNNIFERFYYHLRSRFGAIPLERAATFRQLIGDHQNGIPTMSAFLFDQTPRIYEIQHWVTFLNQDTPVILGAEKLARKLDAVVLFLDSRKIKRGYYEAEFRLVTEHAATCPKFEITETCSRLLEHQINRNPEFWLWSHKKWKHKREKVVETRESELTGNQ